MRSPRCADAASMLLADPAFAFRLLDALGCALIAIDDVGVVAAVNADAHRILGCRVVRPEDALGRDCREVLAGQPTVARLLLDALDGRERPDRAELVLDGPAGVPDATRVIIGFSLRSVRSLCGAVCGSVLFFRDLTPFERIDEQDRLHDRLAALGEMAAGLAHEIRNPLAGMEVMAGLLRRRLVGRAEDLSLLEQLTGELHAVARVVADSLNFVRPVAPVREFLDVVDIVEASLARACSRVAFHGRIERCYDPDLPALAADRDQLLTLVTDLVVNAFEAMVDCGGVGAQELRLGIRAQTREPAVRSLRVDGRPGAASVEGVLCCTTVAPESAHPGPGPAREIVISVGDSGPGVEEFARDRIFYPFFTTKSHGSGVGLATAQKIAASHGGSLELESSLSSGALFRVRLPVEGGIA
jgi:nitrogen-specific signal transduction histidine kinase